MKGDPVKVEVNLARGLPSWHLVGLGDKAIKESIDRIRAAISNSGYDYPRQDVTINLVPAGTPKHGSHFDLPMAIALLAAMGIVKGASYQSFGMVGELSLSGQLQRVSGALLLVQSMKVAGIKNIIVPEGNSTEAAMVQDVGIYPASSLAQVVDYFNGQTLKETGGYSQWRSWKSKRLHRLHRRSRAGKWKTSDDDLRCRRSWNFVKRNSRMWKDYA